MLSKKFFIGLVILSILLSMLFSIYLFQKETRRKSLPVLGKVPEFVLQDSDGKDFKAKELKGKVWVADFIFTTCGGICPIMTKNMAQLFRSFKMLNDVSFVSITVNPEFDTPVVFNEYAKKYGADKNKWHFLSGSREAISRITVEGFKLGSIEEPIFHSAQFALVDRHLRIRGYYDGTDNTEVAQLFKDVATLLKERD